MGIGVGVVISLLGVSPVLAASTQPLHPAVTTERQAAPELTAPAGATEVWLDAEGGGKVIAAAQTRSGTGGWQDALVSLTPFGSTAVATVQPGKVDARWRVASQVHADFSVTFVDARGNILSERLLRNVAVSGDGGWVDWATLAGTQDGAESDDNGDEEAGEGPGGRSEADSTAAGNTDAANDGTASDAQLSRTGSDAMPFLGAGAVLAVAGLGLLARRATRTRRTRAADTEGEAL